MLIINYSEDKYCNDNFKQEMFISGQTSVNYSIRKIIFLFTFCIILVIAIFQKPIIYHITLYDC